MLFKLRDDLGPRMRRAPDPHLPALPGKRPQGKGGEEIFHFVLVEIMGRYAVVPDKRCGLRLPPAAAPEILLREFPEEEHPAGIKEAEDLGCKDPASLFPEMAGDMGSDDGTERLVPERQGSAVRDQDLRTAKTSTPSTAETGGIPGKIDRGYLMTGPDERGDHASIPAPEFEDPHSRTKAGDIPGFLSPEATTTPVLLIP